MEERRESRTPPPPPQNEFLRRAVAQSLPQGGKASIPYRSSWNQTMQGMFSRKIGTSPRFWRVVPCLSRLCQQIVARCISSRTAPTVCKTPASSGILFILSGKNSGVLSAVVCWGRRWGCRPHHNYPMVIGCMVSWRLTSFRPTEPVWSTWSSFLTDMYWDSLHSPQPLWLIFRDKAL